MSVRHRSITVLALWLSKSNFELRLSTIKKSILSQRLRSAIKTLALFDKVMRQSYPKKNIFIVQREKKRKVFVVSFARDTSKCRKKMLVLLKEKLTNVSICYLFIIKRY
jgi:hypothetical protein